MSRNQQKKKTEHRILEAARKAGTPIPTGEVEGEEPDFRFQMSGGVLGIELCEVLRPAVIGLSGSAEVLAYISLADFLFRTTL